MLLGVEERVLPEERRHEFDRWFGSAQKSESKSRCGHCSHRSGKPPWPLAFDGWKIITEELDLQEIEGLSITDARGYLHRAGIVDEALCETLLQYAQLTPGSVHPLFLHLCTEVIQKAKGEGVELTSADFQQSVALADRRKQVVWRFFQHLRNEDLANAAKAVGACRTFGYAVYKELGDKLALLDESHFRELTGFSFVSRIEQGGNICFQIHQLLRRILRDCYGDFIRRAHEALHSYYLLAGTDGIADAIYHQNCLDWRAGITAWVKEIEPAVENGHFALCRTLLSLVPDLIVGDDLARAQLLRCEAGYQDSNRRAPERYRNRFTSCCIVRLGFSY